MEHIDHIFYINLDKRKDRKEHLENELQKMGITNYTRFSAIEDSYSPIGCGLSHINILKEAKVKGYKRIIILEDDYTFVVSKDEFNNKIKNLFESKINFDVCLLSFRDVEPATKTDKSWLMKVNKCATTSGYIINNHYYNKLISIFEECVKKLAETKRYNIFAIDVGWMSLQKEDDWYRFEGRLGIQRPDYSNIENRFVNYCC
jgi:glycosyl transferase family 25